ncbi:hypothetical protein ACFSJY_02300 [Thalassotalea euphylliae]|uniref:hypothetical protein n=1 Tax=Thalassotalea euphylliae TaxID=1655234 RepID=UPI003632CBD7
MKLGFLKSSNFWSVSIAALALLFSLTPPLSEWIPDKDLSMLHSNRTAIGNYFGIVSYGLQIDLKNEGNKPLSITKLVLELTDPDSTKSSLIAETITQFSGGPNAIVTPITRIVIKPDEQWSNLVYFYPKHDPEMEYKINQVRFKIVEDLGDQQAVIGGQRLIRAPRHLVKEAKDLFDQNFDLKKGKYSVKLIAYSEKEILRANSFQFEVHDFQIQANQSQKNDYKYGMGIYGPAQNIKMTWLKNNSIKIKE